MPISASTAAMQQLQQRFPTTVSILSLHLLRNQCPCNTMNSSSSPQSPAPAPPHHLQQRHKYQHSQHRYYAIGLATHSQFSDAFLSGSIKGRRASYGDVAKILGELNPDEGDPWNYSVGGVYRHDTGDSTTPTHQGPQQIPTPPPKDHSLMKWTFNGPEEITDILNSFGCVKHLYCGLYHTVLLLETGALEGGNAMRDAPAGSGRLTTGGLSSSSSNTNSLQNNDSLHASSLRHPSNTHQPHQHHTTPHNLKILTSRTDIYGHLLSLPNIHETSVGNLHMIARRGEEMFCIGSDAFGATGDGEVLSEEELVGGALVSANNLHSGEPTDDNNTTGDKWSAWRRVDVSFDASLALNEFTSTDSSKASQKSTTPRPTARTAAETLPSTKSSSPSAKPNDTTTTTTQTPTSQWKTLTIENTKKRQSPIETKIFRDDVLKSRTQPSHTTVDKNLSHIQQIQELLPQYIKKLSSFSLEQKLTGATNVRKILARDENHSLAVTKFVQGAGIDSCVRFLDHPDEQLLSEVIWILIRVVTTTDNQDYAEQILTNDNVNHLTNLLENSDNDQLLELAVQLVGNLCAHEDSHYENRRSFLPQILQVMSYSPPLSLLRMCAWTIANIVRIIPYEDAKLVMPTFSYIIEDYTETDPEVLLDTCRGLYYLSRSKDKRFANRIDTIVIHKLIEICTLDQSALVSLMENSQQQHQNDTISSVETTPTAKCTALIQDCLKSLAQVVASPLNLNTQRCIEGNILSMLEQQLQHVLDTSDEDVDELYPGFSLDVCWIMSNIACGSYHTIDKLLDTEILGKLMMLTFTPRGQDESIRREIAYTFCNVLSCCRMNQRSKIVADISPLDFMSQFLKSSDTQLVLLILESYEDVLTIGLSLSETIVEMVRVVSEKHPSPLAYKKGQNIVNTTMKHKQQQQSSSSGSGTSGGGSSPGGRPKRLKKMPPKPKTLHIPDMYCTHCATFIVYGRGKQVWAMGRSICLGVGETSFDAIQQTPRLVPQLHLDAPIVSIKGGLEHTLILTESGAVYAAGSNRKGCCGSKKWNAFHAYFTRIPFPDVNMCVKQISCGPLHSVFLSAFNTVFVCGNAADGKLGVGCHSDKPSLVQIRQLTEVKSIFTGMSSTGAILSNKVLMCGDNRWGTLGVKPPLGDVYCRNTATTYPSLRPVDLPPKDTKHHLLETRQHMGGYHSIFSYEYEYTFGERLAMSREETLFTDVDLHFKRLDSSTIGFVLGDEEYELTHKEHHKLFSKDESLHYRLKFLSDLIGLSFESGCLPPANEQEAKYKKPLAGTRFWDAEKVRIVCEWIVEHFPNMQYKFDSVRKELGAAASAWRRKNVHLLGGGVGGGNNVKEEE